MSDISNKAQGDGLVVNGVSSVLLANASLCRNAAIVHNTQGTLYVKLGYGASETDFTYKLTAGSTLEISGYIGALTAIAAPSESTYVRITEIV